jgi:hypothetical protein
MKLSFETIVRAICFVMLLICLNPVGASAQQRVEAGATGEKESPAVPSPPTVEDRLKALEQVIERQQREIETLRSIVEKKEAAPTAARTAEARGPETDRSRVEADQPKAVAFGQTPASGKNEAAPPDQTQKRVEELYKKFGAIRWSGDIRFRVEPFRNQGFDSPVEAPARNRLRIRARLALDGSIDKHFDWGFRVATGIYTDPISANQTLTDFFERKPFALERAFVKYDSKTDGVGVQLVAGKFEPTFRRTQMVWDDDVNVEGASEAIYFKTASSLRQVKLVAFELPFNEVTGGKDGMLYGGQFQSDWQLTSAVTANVNVSYYDWIRADQVLFALALGASANQVNGGIFNGSGVTGGQNGALGTTNRIIRDSTGRPIGFLADFNLFDVLGNLTWQAGDRVPVTFTFDYVRNLTSRIPDEKNGYWAGVQVGQTKIAGDWLAGYTFTRIEQDAVLVPFNFSDILASNSRTHIPTFAYQVSGKKEDTRGVTLQWTGLFSGRVNKVIPLSPVNRYVNRMQFDVIYKF